MIEVYVVLGIIACVAIVLWLLKKEAEARGRAEEQAKSAQQVNNAAATRAQVDSDTNAMSTDALRDKLLNDK